VISIFLDLTEEQKVSRADMEKCKGNEAYNSGCFEEALVYYTRSIQFLPNAASYNNRAMTCNNYI
jgi:sperm-associated antigen 1